MCNILTSNAVQRQNVALKRRTALANGALGKDGNRIPSPYLKRYHPSHEEGNAGFLLSPSAGQCSFRHESSMIGLMVERLSTRLQAQCKARRERALRMSLSTSVKGARAEGTATVPTVSRYCTVS